METIAVLKLYNKLSPRLGVPSASHTIDVVFDDNGFESNEYVAEVSDMLRFQNKATLGNITVYVLSPDGQTASTALLGSLSQVHVASKSSVSMVAHGSGTYLLSLEPLLLDAKSPGDGYEMWGGRTSEIVLDG